LLTKSHWLFLFQNVLVYVLFGEIWRFCHFSMEKQVFGVEFLCCFVGVLGLFAKTGLFLRFFIVQFSAILMVFWCVWGCFVVNGCVLMPKEQRC
jgi:hypothetical protein